MSVPATRFYVHAPRQCPARVCLTLRNNGDVGAISPSCANLCILNSYVLRITATLSKFNSPHLRQLWE
jgi:hypothetical protein